MKQSTRICRVSMDQGLGNVFMSLICLDLSGLQNVAQELYISIKK